DKNRALPPYFGILLPSNNVDSRKACPDGQVFSECSGSCPFTCEDLWPNTQCLAGPCNAGCSCPPGQVLHGGLCVSHAEC
uniref:TIL domain-containing protein n=1 Tax=Hippocampus comes TaxID=109280 RepID=A0A3Q3DW30_HIPCM